MIRTPCFALLVLGAGVATAAHASDLPDSAKKIAADVMAEQSLVGLQVAVGQRGTPEVQTHCLGLASVELKSPMARDTLVPIASVMKALTGILFLKLEAEAGLDRDQGIEELVPEFPERELPLTLDHLVGQTHGIRHYRDEIYPDFFVLHYDQLVDVLPIFAKDDLVAEPGTRFTYSSYAYTLLGLGLERHTGRSFEALLREHVLIPADIERVCANDIRVPIADRTPCYSFYDFRWPFEPRATLSTVPPLDMSYNLVGGNRLASAEDLVRFGRSLLEGKLLDEASMQRLLSSQTTDDGQATGWSHGWFLVETPHGLELRINGSNPGSWASLRAYPESGLVLAMTTNTTGRGSRERPKGLIGPMDALRDAMHRS